MRRLIFSKVVSTPAFRLNSKSKLSLALQRTIKKPTKANVDRMGTIEVAFQRCDASHGEAFVNKETLPTKTVHDKEANKNNIDMVTKWVRHSRSFFID